MFNNIFSELFLFSFNGEKEKKHKQDEALKSFHEDRLINNCISLYNYTGVVECNLKLKALERILEEIAERMAALGLKQYYHHSLGKKMLTIENDTLKLIDKETIN